MCLKGKNVRVRGKWWHYQFEANSQVHSGNTGLEGSERNRIAAENYAERQRQAVLRPQLAAPVTLETEADRRRKPFNLAAAAFVVWARDVEYRGKINTSTRLKVSMYSCVAYFGERPVSELGAGEIEGYKQFRIQEHGVKDITLRHDLHALSVFFRYAIKMCWASGNPIRDVKIPSDRDAVREHVVSEAEEEKYLVAAGSLHEQYAKSFKGALPNMRDLAVLMLEQGARPEELLAARKEHVNLEAATLQIAGGKTRAARRLLNLTPRSQGVLAPRMKSEGPWLFPSDRRPGHHVTRLQGTHDRICIEAGVCFVIYDFRHTWATRMVATPGVDIPTVAAIMGHSGLRTIFRYIHPTAEAQKRAMEQFEAAQRRMKLRAV